MKILFLDIDGVLNYKAFRDVNGYIMNPEHVMRLLTIVRETGCQIVISSNWRTGPLYDITDALKCNDLDDPLTGAEVQEISNVIFSRTEDFVSQGLGSRTDEIISWLQKAVADGQCIDSWVSVDDLSLELPSVNFVQTDDNTGLTDAQMYEIIDKLNIDVYEEIEPIEDVEPEIEIEDY